MSSSSWSCTWGGGTFGPGGWLWSAMGPEGSITARMRVLGLDVGSKTIGIAVSDELGLMAHARLTLDRAGTRKDAEAIAALVEQELAERVVVGLPLTLE